MMKLFSRRKLKRLKTALNVKFRIVSGNNPAERSSEVTCTSKNISPTGLGLESGIVQIDRMHISHDTTMIKKNSLDIAIELPSNNNEKQFETIHILGQVAWYDKPDTYSASHYHIGVDIMEISDGDKSKLEVFIKNC